MATEKMKMVVAAVEQIEKLAYKYRNSWFWSENGNSSSRSWKESQDRVDCIDWIEGGHAYSASWHVSISRRNVYVHAIYLRDGKKTTLTAIRNSAARIKAKLENEESI